MTTSVVTGADRGIGAALCRLLAGRGETVIAACLEQGQDLNGMRGVEVLPGIDVTSDASVRTLAQHLRGRRVDVLVNNAGLVIDRQLGKFDYTVLQQEFAVNALGPLRVVEALLPAMGTGCKIALVTSRVGSLGENRSGGLYGYRMSKAAANMAGLNLAHDLRTRGIAVICLHPGSVRTQMTAGLTDTTTVGMLVDPETAARGLIARIDVLTLESSGSFRHANGETLPW